MIRVIVGTEDISGLPDLAGAKRRGVAAAILPLPVRQGVEDHVNVQDDPPKAEDEAVLPHKPDVDFPRSGPGTLNFIQKGLTLFIPAVLFTHAGLSLLVLFILPHLTMFEVVLIPTGFWEGFIFYVFFSYLFS
jgi:hypothetical protein